MGAGGSDLACYLGSHQMDPSVEQRALRGEYRLVYLTPEKLVSFTPRLAELHRAKGICLFAVDEAHCVSKWGHDFRREFMQLGNFRLAVPDVPIMALTATAVSHVQTDILTSLHLRSPFVARSSVDRPNLRISVRRKLGGMSQDLGGLLGPGGQQGARMGSTIVYVPTTAETDAVCEFLQNCFPTLCVASYHGKKSPVERKEAHEKFLAGTADVIVATVLITP